MYRCIHVCQQHMWPTQYWTGICMDLASQRKEDADVGFKRDVSNTRGLLHYGVLCLCFHRHCWFIWYPVVFIKIYVAPGGFIWGHGVFKYGFWMFGVAPVVIDILGDRHNYLVCLGILGVWIFLIFHKERILIQYWYNRLYLIPVILKYSSGYDPRTSVTNLLRTSEGGKGVKRKI